MLGNPHHGTPTCRVAACRHRVGVRRLVPPGRARPAGHRVPSAAVIRSGTQYPAVNGGSTHSTMGPPRLPSGQRAGNLYPR